MSEGPIPIGLRHHLSLLVDERLIVPALGATFTGFAEMPPVFATAFMVGFVEWACVEALRGRLGAGQATVGIGIEISHVSPTPVGLYVHAEVEVVAVEGRKVRFRVLCRDDVALIGEGFHERYIIDREAFMVRVARKAQSHGGA